MVAHGAVVAGARRWGQGELGDAVALIEAHQLRRRVPDQLVCSEGKWCLRPLPARLSSPRVRMMRVLRSGTLRVRLGTRATL
jgi:hypothetical protein